MRSFFKKIVDARMSLQMRQERRGVLAATRGAPGARRRAAREAAGGEGGAPEESAAEGREAGLL